MTNGMEAAAVRVDRPLWTARMPEIGQEASRADFVRREDLELPDATASVEDASDDQVGYLNQTVLNSIMTEDLPGPGTVILNVDWQHRARLRVGDPIRSEVEVLGVRRDKPITHLRARVLSETGEVVAEGQALCYTMRPRPRRI